MFSKRSFSYFSVFCRFTVSFLGLRFFLLVLLNFFVLFEFEDSHFSIMKNVQSVSLQIPTFPSLLSPASLTPVHLCSLSLFHGLSCSFTFLIFLHVPHSR